MKLRNYLHFKYLLIQRDICIPLGILGEVNGTPLQYSCLENPMDGGTWQAAVNEIAKSRTRLSDFTFTFHFHALEKDMATHSSVLAWRIPGTGSLVGCCLWGRTELDTTEVTQQQQQQWSVWGGSILCLLQTLYTAYIRSPADINTDRDNIKHRCQLSKQLNNFTVYNMQWRFKS